MPTWKKVLIGIAVLVVVLILVDPPTAVVVVKGIFGGIGYGIKQFVVFLKSF